MEARWRKVWPRTLKIMNETTHRLLQLTADCNTILAMMIKCCSKLNFFFKGQYSIALNAKFEKANKFHHRPIIAFSVSVIRALF